MILGFSDYAAAGTITCSQSFASSAPLANLKTRRLGRRARSTAAAGETFRLTVDLGVARVIGIAGLLSPDAMLNPDPGELPGTEVLLVQLSNVSGAGSEVWSGYAVGSRYALCSPRNSSGQALLSARYVSFVFRAQRANWSCGRLWVSTAWWPEHGIDETWSTGQVDTGSARLQRGGAAIPRPGVILDTLSGQMGALSRADVLGPTAGTGLPLKQCLRTVGTTGEVVIVPRAFGRGSLAQWSAENDRMVDQLAVYGRLTGDLSQAIQHQGADNYSAALAVVEER
jgi:hypothetical protein